MSIKFLLKHVDSLKWVYKQEDELLAVWALATTRVIGFLQEKEERSALPTVEGMMWTQVKAGWESKFGFLKHTVSAFLPPLLLSPHILICASWNHVSNKPPAPKSLSQALLLGRSQTKTVSSTTRLSPSTSCTTASGSQGMESDRGQERQPDLPSRPEQTRERLDPAGCAYLLQRRSVLGAGHLSGCREGGWGMVTWDPVVIFSKELWNTEVKAEENILFLCCTKLALLPE